MSDQLNLTRPAIPTTVRGNRGVITAGIIVTAIGLLWIVSFYVSGGIAPIAALANWTIIAGFVLLVAGAIIWIVGANVRRPRSA